MVEFLFGGIVFYLGMMLSTFVGSIILSSLFSGIFLMRRLRKASIIDDTNYGRYIIPLFFWIFIFCFAYWIIISFIKFETIWSIGVIIGFIFSLKTLNHSNMENNTKEFYNTNASLFKNNNEKTTHSLKSDKELSSFIYSKVNDKFNLLNEIIKQSDIFEKYDYEEDYYTIIACMYILICAEIEIIKANEVDIKTSIVLINYFQMISDNLTDVKYKNKDKIMQIFCEEIIPLFRLAWHKANLDNTNEISYVLGFISGYMIFQFLNSVFNIQVDELETNYYNVTEKISDLFMSAYGDEDIIFN
ncbi:MAG: hypothetical protein PHF30_01595 [Bacilli bacterium]|nr:hypothetical protein [Bacilli bacterium]